MPVARAGGERDRNDNAHAWDEHEQSDRSAPTHDALSSPDAHT
jgi:hypothetical protein